MAEAAAFARAEAEPRGVARPWYHRPEWIIALVAVISLVVGGAIDLSKGQSQTAQNSHDIAELKAKIDPVPERLGRIETKLDDLTTFEKRRHAAD